MPAVATAQLAQHCADRPNDWLHQLVAVFDPRCYAYSDAAWTEMADFRTPPPPPAVGAPDTTKPPASGAEAEQTVDNVLARQMTAWQAQNQQFFEEQPYVGDATSTTRWLLIAAGVFALIWVMKR